MAESAACETGSQLLCSLLLGISLEWSSYSRVAGASDLVDLQKHPYQGTRCPPGSGDSSSYCRSETGSTACSCSVWAIQQVDHHWDAEPLDFLKLYRL